MAPQVTLTKPASMAAPVFPSPKPVLLQRVSEALRATHAAKILAVGSSSTAGVGASSPSRTYVAWLETDLETALREPISTSSGTACRAKSRKGPQTG